MNIYFGKLKPVFFILLSIFVFTFIFLNLNTNNSLAQSDGTGEDTPVNLPSASPVQDDPNIFLHDNTAGTVITNVKSSAQKANGKLSGVYEGSVLSCPYAFERDLFVGSRGEDVRLLQVLLNSDRRTLTALDGPGSLGKETSLFGPSTKAAVKKFQALFIEYIGVANGRFGPRTRTTMNAICNGQTKPVVGTETPVYNNVQSVQKNATPQGEITTIPNDKIAPSVTLAANLNSVTAGSDFKIILNASEEIKPLTPDEVSVDFGIIKQIRKLGKQIYSLLITPNDNVKIVTVQIAADQISDLANNLNENASNEVTVNVTQIIIANATSAATDTIDINTLLDKIVASVPTCTYNSVGFLITKDPVSGKDLNTTNCAQSGTANTGGTATFDQSQNCYTDTGTLPNGIGENARCKNKVICNTSYNSYSGSYQQQCQTASQAQQQQQAQQNQQAGSALGQLLGKLMGGGGSGGGGGNALDGTTKTAEQKAAEAAVLQACSKENENSDNCAQARAAQYQAENDAKTTDPQKNYDTATKNAEDIGIKRDAACVKPDSSLCKDLNNQLAQAELKADLAQKRLEDSLDPDKNKPDMQKYADCMQKSTSTTNGECDKFNPDSSTASKKDELAGGGKAKVFPSNITPSCDLIGLSDNTKIDNNNNNIFEVTKATKGIEVGNLFYITKNFPISFPGELTFVGNFKLKSYKYHCDQKNGGNAIRPWQDVKVYFGEPIKFEEQK